jgi:hypothetical protein
MTSQRQTIRLRAWLVGLSLTTALPGCFLLPVYHQPQGFSSTYYRHLQETAQSQAMLMTPPPMVTPPPVEVSEANASSTGNWWSWIRNPLSPRVAANDEDDTAETDAMRQ